MNIFNDYTILHGSPPPDRLFMKMQAGLKKRPASWEDGREKRPLQETLGLGQCVEVRRKDRRCGKRTPPPESGSHRQAQGSATGPLGKALIR